MLTSISPLGERARGNRYGVTTAAHVVGAAAGGALSGAAAGAAGWALLSPVGADARDAVGLAVIAALLGLALLVDRVGVPTIRRQVDERWLGAYRGWAYGAGYGVQLGMAVVTIVPSAILYAALGAAAATGSVGGGTIVGAAFGLGRGAGVLLGARVRSPEDLARLHRRVAVAAPRAARTVSIAAATIGIGVVVALGTAAA